MKNTNCWLGSLLLIASLAAPIATIGCAAHARYYDVEYRDYHRWSPAEDRYYRQYLAERHEQYRDFNKRNKEEQADYWKWRHNHPGN